MHRHIYLSFVLLFLLLPLTNSQPQDYYLKEYKKAEQLYFLENPTEETDQQALQLYHRVAIHLSGIKSYDSIVFDCYLKSGILQQSAGEQSEAIASFGLANAIQQNSSLSDSLRFKPYLFIGTAHYSLNNFDSAAYFFNLAEALLARYPRLGEQERLFNKKGTMYYETGNYIQSKFYFEKALSVIDTTTESKRYFLVNYKNNIASALRKLQQYREALEIYQSLLPYGIERNGLLHNMGDTYLGMGDYRKAIEYLRSTSYANEKKYNDLGFAYLKVGQLDSAETYLNKALSFSNLHQKSTTIGVTLSNLAELNVLRANVSKALQLYQLSIIQLDPDFNDERITENPKDFRGIHSYFNLFEAIAGKANAWHRLYQSNGKEADLIAAINTLEAGLRLANQTESTYESDEARLFLNERVQPAYQSLVNWYLHLFQNTHHQPWLQHAIQVSEISKAAVLQAGVQQLELKGIRGLPQELISKEKNLKGILTRTSLLMNTSEDSSQLMLLQQQLLDAEIELSKVHEQLNSQPSYTSLWNRSAVDISKIQKALSNEEAIVSFYFTGTSLVTFVVDKDSVDYSTYNGQATIIDQIKALIPAMNMEANSEEITSLSSQLYNQLFKPILPLVKQHARLIISPHNELSYLPFELLRDENGKQLLNEFAFRYTYSIAFLDRKTNSEKNSQLAAFAPFASASFPPLGLNSIPASRKEVSSLKGRIYLDSVATKQSFIELSSRSGVIHLATHAATNDSLPLESFIAFYPNKPELTSFKLFEPEIYNLDMQASRLIILSACETGRGKLIKGEGILSFSRAFSYAGCPSIITSLWKADDESTAYICTRLHHYFSKGLTKDLALQKAKLDYLDDKNIPSQFKLPRYWAHLILIGDASPVEDDIISSIKMAILLIAGIVVIVVILTATRILKRSI